MILDPLPIYFAFNKLLWFSVPQFRLSRRCEKFEFTMNRMSESLDIRCLNTWMDEWIDFWMNECLKGYLDDWKEVWLDG